MSAVDTARGGTAVSDATGTAGAGNGGTETAGPSSPRRRRRYLREPVPWRRSDVTRAVLLLVVGIVLGAVAWVGTSGQVTLRDQQGWIVLACLAAAVGSCGGVYFVTVAMREVRLGQRQLMFDLADVMGWSVTVTKRGRLQMHAAEEAAEATAATETAPIALVVGAGMTIVHRSECPIARNKPVEPISATEAAARGLGSCGVCRSEVSAA